MRYYNKNISSYRRIRKATGTTKSTYLPADEVTKTMARKPSVMNSMIAHFSEKNKKGGSGRGNSLREAHFSLLIQTALVSLIQKKIATIFATCISSKGNAVFCL